MIGIISTIFLFLRDREEHAGLARLVDSLDRGF